jgi:hypothetical protein
MVVVDSVDVTTEDAKRVQDVLEVNLVQPSSYHCQGGRHTDE